MLPNQSGELSSWKEIAAYLGVSVRTAQAWERARTLPVRRLPGPRAHVRALTTELDAWKFSLGEAVAQEEDTVEPATEELASSSTIDNSTERDTRNPKWLWGAAAVLAIVIVVAAIVWRVASPLAQPVSAHVEINALVVLDEEGKPLWRRDFDKLNTLSYREQDQRIWVGDVDQDGSNEVLFVPTIQNAPEESVPLLCFDRKGREKWRFVPGKPLQQEGEAIEPPFIVRQFRVMNGKIVVTSHHYPYYPSQVAVLNGDGRKLREYFHPGHLNTMLPAMYEGKPVIMLTGTNNARHAATLVVLDPDQLAGASVEDGKPVFDGMQAGVEVARLIFPRSCLNARFQYNYAFSIHPTTSGFTVEVRENTTAETSSIYYHLDSKLQLRDIGLGDSFVIEHKALHAANMLDHEWNDNEVATLRAVVRVK